MSNTANTRLYKTPVNMVIKVPHAGVLAIPVKRNVYFRRSDKSPYIVVKGLRKDVHRTHRDTIDTNNGIPAYQFVEVLQRSR